MLYTMALVIVIIRQKMGHEIESNKLHFVATGFEYRCFIFMVH